MVKRAMILGETQCNQKNTTTQYCSGEMPDAKNQKKLNLRKTGNILQTTAPHQEPLEFKGQKSYD